MPVNVAIHGAVTIVRPDAALALETASDVRETLLDVVERSRGRVVVDLSDTPYCDSAGIEGLLDVNDILLDSGRSLKLANVNEVIRLSLQVTEVASSFEYFVDVQAAVRSFQ